ncbi:MAG TPA: glycosyltransferase [Bacteroidia bacterium]|nr:glycosyltransferase [Bacteroidia bacterium]
MKRILLLSDVNSAHTQKWAGAVSEAGFKTAIFSLSAPELDWFTPLGIRLLSTEGYNRKQFYAADLLKSVYFLSGKKVRRAILEFRPDIVHAHYLSSYGTLGRISGFHPLVISAWGSDLLDFPKRSFLHKALIHNNLRAADVRIAASAILEKEIRESFHLSCITIPFGIDTERFCPVPAERQRFQEEIVIGTIKSLEPVYAPEILIQAFAEMIKEFPHHSFRLLLVGEGSMEQQLRKLVEELNISAQTTFQGKVNYNEVQRYHNQMDIFANLSLQESFGVSVLEASACGKPVIVSNAPGLQEVFRNNQTGIAVGIRNVNETKLALSRLVQDAPLRTKMGEAGRKFVTGNFDWKESVKKLIAMYQTSGKA